MLCGLFGSLVMLMQESDGVLGFSRLAHKVLKTRKASMLGTWVLGMIVFVDDYLNALAVGAAVRDITDKNRVSREMLAYIVNSTGVTVCAIIPISTWGAFMSAQMKTANMTEGLSATSAYVHTIPFMVYAWLTVIIVLSYVLIEVNGQLGLVPFIVDVALKTVNPGLLPVTIFIVIGLLFFASGSFWGLAIVAFPIVGPLALAMEVNTFLCAGALISAIPFVITTIIFTILGFIM